MAKLRPKKRRTDSSEATVMGHGNGTGGAQLAVNRRTTGDSSNGNTNVVLDEYETVRSKGTTQKVDPRQR